MSRSVFRTAASSSAGDAAHLMPPNGGFGGNTGIHDAHNLAWKLALVLKGHASPRLLETTRANASPSRSSRWNRRSRATWRARRRGCRPARRQIRWCTTSISSLGISYGVPDDQVHADPRTTHGHAGLARAACLAHPQGRARFHHRPDRSLPAARRPEGAGWIPAAREAAGKHRRTGLDAWCIGQDLEDPESRFTQDVRPDLDRERH